MTLAASAVIAVIFASGAFLIQQRDLLRVIVGIVLISNASVLFVMASGLSRGKAPIYPLGAALPSDPLVQAMALTALVIGSSVAALLLALVYRLYVSHRSIDIEDLSKAELEAADALERVNKTEFDSTFREEPIEEEQTNERELEKEEPR